MPGSAGKIALSMFALTGLLWLLKCWACLHCALC